MSLYERHIAYGIRKFGKKAMQEANLGTVEDRNYILSILVVRGKRLWFSTERVKGAILHNVSSSPHYAGEQ